MLEASFHKDYYQLLTIYGRTIIMSCEFYDVI